VRVARGPGPGNSGATVRATRRGTGAAPAYDGRPRQMHAARSNRPIGPAPVSGSLLTLSCVIENRLHMRFGNRSKGCKVRCASNHLIVSVCRVPQMQGVGRADVLLYFKCPTTRQMRCPVNAYRSRVLLFRNAIKEENPKCAESMDTELSKADRVVKKHWPVARLQ